MTDDGRQRWERAVAIHREMTLKERKADALYDMLSAAGDDALAGRDASLRREWGKWQELLGELSGLTMAYDMLAPEGLDAGILEWYRATYPDDGFVGDAIGEWVTFADFDAGIRAGKSFESALGTPRRATSCDAMLIHRRCVERLAEMWGVGYDDVYYEWIDHV